MRIPAELAQTLAVTADTGSLEAAAKVLHISQPAVSQRLRLLERHTGQVLLVRSRPVRPTPAGEAVIRYARQVQHLEDDTAVALGLDGALRTMLPIAVNADSLATWFMAPIARLAARRGLTFDLHREDEDFTANLLESGTVLAAVTTRQTPIAGCASTPLGRMTYRAVAAREFADAHFAAGVTAETLGLAPMVDFNDRDDLQSAWLRAMGADEALPPRHRVPSSTEFAQAIALGLGWGLLPAAQRAPHPHLVDLGGRDVHVTLHLQRWRIRSDTLDEVAGEIIAAAREALD
ncbi:MAG: LysR family transcriptional regulator ArgP [Demequinaceae bacterium]|nr:LysR family transcriptional regulator ArgP [Demequinaceae bacterium]